MTNLLTGLTILLTSIPWLVLVLLIYKTPEKVEKWVSLFSRAFSWANLRFEKKAVAGDIQSELKSFKKEIDSVASANILPYSIKINWEPPNTTREAFVRNNEIIVKMSHHRNQAKNFLYATLSYVEKGLIPKSRYLLEKKVLRAVDLIFIKKILSEKKRHDVKQLFYDQIFEPEVTKGSLLERYCSIFDDIDETGGFTGIVLEEFAMLGENAGSNIPTDETSRDTVRFMQMLERFVRRNKGEDVNPTYSGAHIKCSIVLVARSDVYLMYGLSPYIGWINKCISEGIRTFYICAIGGANISIVRRIRDAYQSSKKVFVSSEKIHELPHGNQAICLILVKNN